MNWEEHDGAIWVEAARVSDLDSGRPLHLKLSPAMPGWKQRHDVEVFVVGGSENPAVLFAECSHQRCPVDWEGDGFVCHCHGSMFDSTGNVITGPAERPLIRIQSYVEGQAIWAKVRDKP